MTSSSIAFEPIGFIQSCYKEKFGIPRQAGLVTTAEATLTLHPPFNRAEAVRGLNAYSHIWLIFLFHASQRNAPNASPRQTWKPTVRPPRLGGNERLGVFATRSNFRPNAIGLSAVELVGIDTSNGQVVLYLRGTDLLNGTPVLDIKPYLPYADQLPDATSSFASEPPSPQLEVVFSTEAEAALTELAPMYPAFRALIVQTLQLDPRPAYYTQRPSHTQFGIKLYDFDLKWEVREGRVWVVGIEGSKVDYRPIHPLHQKAKADREFGSAQS